MSEDLVNWLRAQLDEDVRGVLEWIEPREDGMLSTPLRPVHQLTDRVGAERMLAEVDAKRRRLDLIVELAPHHPDVALRLAKLDALPYADRPGYRPEWEPTSAPA